MNFRELQCNTGNVQSGSLKTTLWYIRLQFETHPTFHKIIVLSESVALVCMTNNRQTIILNAAHLKIDTLYRKLTQLIKIDLIKSA